MGLHNMILPQNLWRFQKPTCRKKQPNMNAIPFLMPHLLQIRIVENENGNTPLFVRWAAGHTKIIVIRLQHFWFWGKQKMNKIKASSLTA